MGVRGPVPKRSDQRHGHRSKVEQGVVTHALAGGAVVPEPDDGWHRIAREWFVALGASGQSVFFEDSDWATARYVAEAMSRNLQAGRFSAQLFAAVLAGTTGLLCTEGDRRRLRIELERGTANDADDDASVSALDRYRDSLGA